MLRHLRICVPVSTHAQLLVPVQCEFDVISVNFAEVLAALVVTCDQALSFLLVREGLERSLLTPDERFLSREKEKDS